MATSRWIGVAMRRAMGWGLALWGLGVLGMMPSAHAQSVHATVSADSVKVGARFTLSLVATYPPGARVLFPPADSGQTMFGNLEVIRRQRAAPPTGDASGLQRARMTYEVTTFALDTARVPPLTVRLVNGADTTRLTSATLHIPIQSTLPANAQQPRALAPLATFPAPRWPWVLLGLAALAVAGGLAYWWHRRRRTPPSPAAAPSPALPPYEWAQQRLRHLEATTDWNDAAALEAFYDAISALLRKYLAARLDIIALERTTGELVRVLRRRSDLPPRAVNAVETILQDADLVKFADRRPTGQEARLIFRATAKTIEIIDARLSPPATDAEEEASTPATRKGRKEATE